MHLSTRMRIRTVIQRIRGHSLSVSFNINFMTDGIRKCHGENHFPMAFPVLGKWKFILRETFVWPVCYLSGCSSFLSAEMQTRPIWHKIICTTEWHPAAACFFPEYGFCEFLYYQSPEPCGFHTAPYSGPYRFTLCQEVPLSLDGNVFLFFSLQIFCFSLRDTQF